MGNCLPAGGNISQTETAHAIESSSATKTAPIPKVLIIQNDVLAPPASAIVSLTEHNIPYQIIYAFHELSFRNIEPQMYEAIIVLGGRLAVYDHNKLKWLQNEIKFIETALKDKVPILGICLGAQILAHCAGGEVFLGDKGVEIGYQDWIFADDEKAKDTDNDNDIKTDADTDVDLDPFIHALKVKDMDKFVILFHADTFSLPPKCKVSGEDIKVLAKTTKYLTLYRIGQYCYGFQGHPELNHDLVKIWTQAWGKEFVEKADVDIEKDVVGYSLKNKDLIDKSSKILFDIWIDVALVHSVPKLRMMDTTRFDEYAASHWNAKDVHNEDYPVAYCGTPQEPLVKNIGVYQVPSTRL